MNQCIICKNILIKNQLLYCSVKCKSINHKNNNYIKQQDRGLLRKIYFIQQLGGKCNRCGYDKNISVLSFHHIDPIQKRIKLDIRSMSNNSFNVLQKEINKCELLCSNCHNEHHNSDSKFILENYSTMKYEDIKSREYKKEKINVTCSKCNLSICKQNKSGLCIKCSKTQPKYNLRKNRPNKEILLEEIKIMNWSQLGRKYNVGHKTVKKWALDYNLI